MTPPALELRGIHKRFGPVHALRGANFMLMPGELHALLGENGAGKTTLMHVAYGLTRPDQGEILVYGFTQTVASPRVARRLRIGMVHQHFTSVPALSVAENVALATGWPVAPGPLRRRVLALSRHVGLLLDPDLPAGSLTVGLKQRLEIVKALATETNILLLDEPTAVLAPSEAEELLRVVREFTAKGGSAVLITHKLYEVLDAADRVTVLRQGTVAFEGLVAGQTAATLAAAMIGGDPGAVRRPGTGDQAPDAHGARGEILSVDTAEGQPAIVASGVDIAREDGIGIAVRQASLIVRSGEIVGIAAVEGNGQRELLRAVAGRAHQLRGRLEVAQPLGFVPEDRTTEGLILDFSITENVVLATFGGEPWLRRGGIDWSIAREAARSLLADYDVAAPGPDMPVAALSGGNQQKVVVGREMSRAPRVIVAEDPTRGLDIRATEALHRRIRAAAADGAAVLFHSSDLDEVLELSHRVVVMVRGSVLQPAPDASRAAIGQMMVTGGR